MSVGAAGGASEAVARGAEMFDGVFAERVGCCQWKVLDQGADGPRPPSTGRAFSLTYPVMGSSVYLGSLKSFGDQCLMRGGSPLTLWTRTETSCAESRCV